MKKCFLILFAVSLGLAQVPVAIRGKAAVYCAQLKNSYGQGDTITKAKSKTYAPWRFKVDTAFVDTDGLGHYKKIGTGVAGAGDTSTAFSLRYSLGSTSPLGFFTVAGYRTSANDSGAFALKPLCWSALSKAWLTSKNMVCDTLNQKCDTLLTVPTDSGAFAIERYFPAFCDSMKVVPTVKGVAGRSTDTANVTDVSRMGVCFY